MHWLLCRADGTQYAIQWDDADKVWQLPNGSPDFVARHFDYIEMVLTPTEVAVLRAGFGHMRPVDENTPKDKPILAFCHHEADAFYSVVDAWAVEAQNGPWREPPPLTLYAAHAENLSHAPTGFHIIVWGGGFSDSVDDGGAYMPDWWFVEHSEFERAANPILWCELPTVTNLPKVI